MNINVTRTEVIVGNGYIVNKGEYKINPCVFTFSQEYTNLVKKAVFDDGKTTKEMAIINNRCELPYEVLDSDSFQLRVYAYRVNEQELELVYSPTPAIIYLREGSYRGVTGSGEIITPTQYEQYEQALNDGLDDLEAGLQEVSNVDIDVSKSGNTATVTITDRQGTEKSVEIFDGDDYVLTEEDKQEIINTVEAEVSLDIPTKVSQLENDSAYINKEVNNLTNYTLKTNTGSSIELSINNSTYVMTLNLKNSAGTTISTGTIDLPLETMVVGATYDNTNKKIVLTLKNGSTIDVPVADLVSGLQSEINSNNKLSSDLVDDTNHTNKFVTASEKEQITTNATDISNIKDGTLIDSFGDVETALSGKEDTSNKTGTLDSSSTTTQYPSAKTVYDNFVTRDEEIEKLQTENAQLLADHPDILDENNEFPSGTDLILNGTGDLEMKVDVGGNSTQVQYSGKNKWSLGNISINGTYENSTSLLLGEIYFETGNYTINLSKELINSSYLYIGPSGSIATNIIKQSTFSVSEAGSYAVRCVRQSGIYNNFEALVQLEQGSTATNYEPYVGGTASPNPTYKQDINNVEGDVEVKAESRNMLVLEDIAKTTKNGVTYKLEKNKLYINGTCSTSFELFRKSIAYNSNDYTIQVKILSGSISGNANSFNVLETNSTRHALAFNGNAYLTFTGDISSVFTNINNGAIFQNAIIGFQIEKGTTATPYVPFGENTVTFPLSQGQKLMLGDTLEDDGIHHKRGQVVLTGTEGWDLLSGSSFRTLLSADTKNKGNASVGLSSHFVCEYSNDINCFYFNNSTPAYLVINMLSTITTVNDLKSWLAQQYANNTPVIVEYELETETIEPYTPAQQIAYNKLKEMQSYYDLTYVVGSSDNAQPILTVQAKKSLKVMQSEIDAIKQAILNS